MKKIALAAFVALLAGCGGHGSSAPPTGPIAEHGSVRVTKSTGGPGTTSVTYYDTYTETGLCSPGVLGLDNGSAPAQNLSFPAGQGPRILVNNCNGFTTSQYVRVTLGTPQYGTPYLRNTDFYVTVDAPAAAKVTATWTALGPTLPGTPGLSGTVNYTIGPSADSTVLWKTQGGDYALPASGVPPDGAGQCGAPVFSGNNASFTATRNTNYTYHNGIPGSSTCYRNQMDPYDVNTGTNFLLNMGTHYTFNFQTVVTLNGNYVDYLLANNHIAFDLPAIVWQTHSYGGSGSPCAVLVIDNTWKANYNNSALWPNPPSGGRPYWSFHTCDDGENYASTWYNATDTLTEGQVDLWQIDVDAAYQLHGNGTVVVQRNGSVVYNNTTGHICDNSTPECFWNFGAYPFYYETSEEPTGWNNAGITVQVNDMTLTTPSGGQVLSRKRGVSSAPQKPPHT